MGQISIYEYLEDHDNSELNESEWQEQMEEAVEAYNEEYGTEYSPRNFVRNYKMWKRDKYEEES